MKREFLQEFRVGDQCLPKEVVDAIMAENGKDIQTHREQAAQWEKKYNEACADHSRQLETIRFESRLAAAVDRAKGHNVKAISALLDLDSLRACQEDKALDDALEALKKEHGYLFRQTQNLPVYAPGTGVRQTSEPAQESLAGALKERFKL